MELKRISAFATDYVICMLPVVIPMLIHYPIMLTTLLSGNLFHFYFLFQLWPEGNPFMLSTIIGIALCLFYFPVTTLLFRGQTIGKKIFRIIVTKSDESKLDFNTTMLREMSKAVYFISPIAIPVALVLFLYSKERLAPHDIIFHTRCREK